LSRALVEGLYSVNLLPNRVGTVCLPEVPAACRAARNGSRLTAAEGVRILSCVHAQPAVAFSIASNGTKPILTLRVSCQGPAVSAIRCRMSDSLGLSLWRDGKTPESRGKNTGQAVPFRNTVNGLPLFYTPTSILARVEMGDFVRLNCGKQLLPGSLAQVIT